jgi:DNA-binding PadR family transcriptional regulator
MSSKGWFEILEICRAISSTSPSFTAPDLAVAAKIEDIPPRPKPDGSGITEGSKKEQIASAWLSKFVKWKYAIVSGKKDTGGRRPANLYSLTEAGKTCVLREGRASTDLGTQAIPATPLTSPDRLKLAGLVDAFYDFAAKRGTKQEEEAFQSILFAMEELKEDTGI